MNLSPESASLAEAYQTLMTAIAERGAAGDTALLARLAEIDGAMERPHLDEAYDAAYRNEPLVEEKDAATAIGVEPRSFREMRTRGGGPPYYQLPGSKVARYRMSEVEHWLTAAHVPHDLPSSYRLKIEKLRAKATGRPCAIVDTHHSRVVKAQRDTEDREARQHAENEAYDSDPDRVRARAILAALSGGGSDSDKAEALTAALKKGQRP